MGEGRSEAVPLVLSAPVAGAAPLPPVSAGPVASPGAPVPAPRQDAAPAPGSLRKTLGFASLAVGGAGLVMGAATGGYVLSQHGTLKSECTGGKCPPQDVSKLNTYDAMGAASTAGFIGGGVLAALGVVLVVTAPKAAPAGATVGFTVRPLSGGGAFGAEGSF